VVVRYQVVIDVSDNAECKVFEDWLKRYQNEIIGISENSGCGCCVNIFTVELLDGAIPLAMFNQVETDQALEMRYGLEKNLLINDYLNHS